VKLDRLKRGYLGNSDRVLVLMLSIRACFHADQFPTPHRHLVALTQCHPMSVTCSAAPLCALLSLPSGDDGTEKKNRRTKYKKGGEARAF
jgi:hypothetical protein